MRYFTFFVLSLQNLVSIFCTSQLGACTARVIHSRAGLEAAPLDGPAIRGLTLMAAGQFAL